MSKKHKETSITDLVTTSQDGPDIIKAGLARYQSERTDRTVSFVTSSIDQIQRLESQVEEWKAVIGWHKQRLEAIHAGKFRIKSDGMIVFNDPNLNEEGRR